MVEPITATIHHHLDEKDQNRALAWQYVLGPKSGARRIHIGNAGQSLLLSSEKPSDLSSCRASLQ